MVLGSDARRGGSTLGAGNRVSYLSQAYDRVQKAAFASYGIWHTRQGRQLKKLYTKQNKNFAEIMMQRGAMEKPDDVHPSFA